MENNYQLSRVHNYVHGLMSKEDMYALEKEALDDPFLQDAIEGYKLQNGVDVKQLSLLQQRLATRIASRTIHRDKRFYSWQRLSVGLAAAVMFVTVCSLILFKYFPNQKQVNDKVIVISDAIYEYSVIPLNYEGDVVPEGSWMALYDLLNHQYSNNQKFEGELYIRFDVDSNKRAKNIQITGLKEGRDEELEDLIKNKVKWKGNTGSFVLDIKKINI